MCRSVQISTGYQRKFPSLGENGYETPQTSKEQTKITRFMLEEVHDRSQSFVLYSR